MIISKSHQTIRKIEVIQVGPAGPPPAKGLGRAVITPATGLRDDEQLRSGLPPASVWTVVVRVWDDEGRYGLGSAGFGTAAARPLITEHLSPLLLGRRVVDVETNWAVMYRSTLNIGRKGVVLSAISAIDIALWDLLGKALEAPVYDLLGGRTKPAIPVYASRLYATEDLDALAAEARSYADAGFSGVKQRLAYGPSDGKAGIEKNIELIRAVAEAIDPTTEHMVDAYMGWDLGYAVRMIRRIEQEGFDLRWIEEPLSPDAIGDMAALRGAINTPIAAGEHEYTRYGFRQLIEAGAADVLQPDVNRAGGITEARKIWALAASHDLPVVPHAGQMHNYHLVMSQVNSPMAEHFIRPDHAIAPDEDEIFYRVFSGEPDADGGLIRLMDSPGLGIDLNEEFVRSHEVS